MFKKIWEASQVFVDLFLIGRAFRGAGVQQPQQGGNVPPAGNASFWERVKEVFPALSRDDERGYAAMCTTWLEDEYVRLIKVFLRAYDQAGYDHKQLELDIWQMFEEKRAEFPGDRGRDNPAILILEGLALRSIESFDEQIEYLEDLKLLKKKNLVKKVYGHVEKNKKDMAFDVVIVIAILFSGLLTILFW